MLLPIAVALAVDTTPMDVYVVGDRVVWLDSTGEAWSVADTLEGKPVHLTDQHDSAGFMLSMIHVHGSWIAASDRGLVTIDLSTGAATDLGKVADPLYLATDGDALYASLFQKPQVMRVARDGTATTLFELPGAAIAYGGSTLYAASYSTGKLVAYTGKTKTLATKLPHPTAIAADDTYVYVACEGDNKLHRFDASGKDTVIASDLSNSDVLVVDGGWVYYYVWAGGKGHDKLERVSTDGKTAQTLADALSAPTSIAVGRSAVYANSRDDRRIVRIDKPR